MDRDALYALVLPAAPSGLSALAVVWRVMLAITIALTLLHLVVRGCKGQLRPFRLRSTPTGTLLCPQAGVLLAAFGLVTAIIGQAQIEGISRVYLHSQPDPDWLTTTTILTNWNYVPLALGAWCVCWSTLLAALLPSSTKMPSALLLNITFFAVTLVFLASVGALSGVSEWHFAQAVAAFKRALDGDLDGLLVLPVELDRNIRLARSGDSVFAFFLWSMSVLYAPCALLHIRVLQRQIRYASQPMQIQVYTGDSTHLRPAQVATETTSKRAEVSALVTKMRFLILEMVIFLLALAIYASVVTWNACHEDDIQSSGALTATLVSLLHLTFCCIGSLIAIGATARLLVRSSGNIQQRDGFSHSDSEAAMALGPLQARQEEKRAQQAAGDRWPSRPTTRDGPETCKMSSPPGSRDGHDGSLLDVKVMGRSFERFR